MHCSLHHKNSFVAIIPFPLAKSMRFSVCVCVCTFCHDTLYKKKKDEENKCQEYNSFFCQMWAALPSQRDRDHHSAHKKHTAHMTHCKYCMELYHIFICYRLNHMHACLLIDLTIIACVVYGWRSALLSLSLSLYTTRINANHQHDGSPEKKTKQYRFIRCAPAWQPCTTEKWKAKRTNTIIEINAWKKLDKDLVRSCSTNCRKFHLFGWLEHWDKRIDFTIVSMLFTAYGLWVSLSHYYYPLISLIR